MTTAPFLTAEWRNIVLVTYAVDPDALRLRLAEGLELDEYDGAACVSLVAFDFLNTRVGGRRWPGFVNFPEINLRFYVREKSTGRRGVMFIRELVPSRVVATIARRLYNEPYYATRMQSVVRDNGETLFIQHDWSWRGRKNWLRVTSSKATGERAPDSVEHFFKEHQWGFGRSKTGDSIVYEVRHPVWRCHAVRSVHVDVDFAAQYGAEFAALTGAEPLSVAHAEGSAIEVHPPSALRS